MMNADDVKVGDIVTTKVVVEKINDMTMRVHTRFIDGRADVSFWVDTEEIEPVNDRTPPVKPAKKYQVGDEVIHINRPQMGIGTIVKVNNDDRTYSVEIDSRGKFIDMPNELNMDYIVDWQFYPNSDYAFFPSNWVHAEEFLLPARRKEN